MPKHWGHVYFKCQLDNLGRISLPFFHTFRLSPHQLSRSAPPRRLPGHRGAAWHGQCTLLPGHGRPPSQSNPKIPPIKYFIWEVISYQGCGQVSLGQGVLLNRSCHLPKVCRGHSPSPEVDSCFCRTEVGIFNPPPPRSCQVVFSDLRCLPSNLSVVLVQPKLSCTFPCFLSDGSFQVTEVGGG